MATDNSKKYEELIAKKTAELNLASSLNFENYKNEFNNELKEIENEKNEFFHNQDELKEIIYVDKDFLLGEQDELIRLITNNLKQTIDSLGQSTLKKNMILETKIKELKDSYNSTVNTLIASYDENKKRLKEKENFIVKNNNFNCEEQIINNQNEIIGKTSLIEKASAHYAQELRQNKQIFLDQATKTNNGVKKIKKDYINKEDELKRNFEYTIYKLNERIKEIQTRSLEEQKPFLNTFKEQFEDADKKMHEVRNNYTIELAELEKTYREKIQILADNISFYRAKIKKKTITSLELETYQKNLEDISKTYHEAVREDYALFSKNNNDIEQLHNIQKESESQKNLNISIIKAEADYEIMEIQENIKYQNQLYDFQKKLLKCNEHLEINSLELTLGMEEIKRTFNDNIATSNENGFRNDYNTKIEILKVINDSIRESEDTKKHILLFDNMINGKSNEAITNLLIEKVKKEHDYEIDKINNYIEQNNILFEKNKRISEIRAQLKIDKIEYKKISIEQDHEIRFDSVNKRKNIKEIDYQYKASIIRLDYAEKQKRLKSSSIINLANMENDVFITAVKSLNNILISISNELKESLYTNFKTFGITKIEKMLQKASKDRMAFIKSYFKSIENIINKKIDDLASYRYNAIKADLIEAKNELITKTKTQIESDQAEIEKRSLESGDNDTQIIYLEIDNGSIYGRIKFLTNELKETKKDKEFNQEKLVKRYTTEINSLNETLKSNLEEIRLLRRTIKQNNLFITKLRKEIEVLEHSLKSKEHYYDKRLNRAEKSKVKEAKIYYDTIDKIGIINKQFQTHFHQIDLELLLTFRDEKLRKSMIYPIIDKEISFTNHLTNKIEALLTVLFTNVKNEQNEIIFRSKYRLNDLRIRAKKTAASKKKSENIRSAINIKKCIKIKKNLIKKSKEKTKLHINELLKVKSTYDEKAFKLYLSLEKMDNNFRNIYKAINKNMNVVRYNLEQDANENYASDCNHILEIAQNLQVRKSELNDNLINNNLSHTREIAIYESKYKESILKLKETNENEKEELNQVKKELDDTISSLKKMFDSAKEEISVEKLQFYDDVKAKENKALRPQAFVSRQFNRLNNYKVYLKIRKKWKKISSIK